MNLAAPSIEAAKLIDDFGIKIKKLDDGTMDLVGTLRQFEGFDLNMIKKMVPDKRAAKGMLALTQNLGVLVDMIEEMKRKAGTTEFMYGIMEKTFAIQMVKLKENLMSAIRELARVGVEHITPMVIRINDELNKIGDIGWNNVGKSILDNFNLIFESVRDSMIVIFKSMIPISVEIFKVVGQAAMSAIKYGMELVDFDIQEIMFSNKSKRNFQKLVKKYGVDAAKAFIESGDFGKIGEKILTSEDLSLLAAKFDGLGIKFSDNFKQSIEKAKQDIVKNWDVTKYKAGELEFAKVPDDISKQLLESFPSFAEIAKLDMEKVMPILSAASDDIQNIWKQTYEKIMADSKKYFEQETVTLTTTSDILFKHFDSNNAKSVKNTISKINTIEQAAEEFMKKFQKGWSKKRDEYSEIVQGMELAFVGAFSRAFSNIDKLSEVTFRNVLKNFRNMLIQMAVEQAAMQIFKFALAFGSALLAPATGGASLGVTAAALSPAGEGLVPQMSNGGKLFPRGYSFGASRVIASSYQQDSINANLMHGESINTVASTNMFGNEIARMNQIAESGKISSGTEVHLHFHSIDPNASERYARENPAVIKNMIKIAMGNAR